MKWLALINMLITPAQPLTNQLCGAVPTKLHRRLCTAVAVTCCKAVLLVVAAATAAPAQQLPGLVHKLHALLDSTLAARLRLWLRLLLAWRCGWRRPLLLVRAVALAQ
jgi:hypothetical protein